MNLNGEVIGINTAIAEGAQSIGFAIPINMAKKLIPQLVEKGKITDRGWLGVQIQPMTDELAKSFGLEEGRGALVGDVIAGSPAEKVGLKRGDIILKFNDQNIGKSNELPGLVASTQSGKTVMLEILRDGKRQMLNVVLGKQELGEEAGLEKSGQGGEATVKKTDILGFVIRPLSAEDAQALGVPQGKGMLISRVEPGSSAEEAGVRSGDILFEVNGKTANSDAEYEKAISGVKKGNIVRLLIKRDNATIYVAFKV